MAPNDEMKEVAADKPANSDCTISHQKVELDIDLLTRNLKGRTEITIVPDSNKLRVIKLNCRQSQLTRVVLNNRPCFSIGYDDPYKNAHLPYRSSVHQYHLLQKKIESEAGEEELEIRLSDKFKFEKLNLSPEEAQSLVFSKPTARVKSETLDPSSVDASQSVRPDVEQSPQYAPITLIIEYTIRNLRDGMHFVGWEKGDLQYPHAYSTNSLAPEMVRCLFPCFDELTARCTWEISIKCSRTLGDAFSAIRGDLQALKNKASEETSAQNGSSPVSKEDAALELAVICTGDVTDEIVDPRDPTKKTVSFICASPISAQHIGFAIGPFETVDLSKFRDSDEDDRLGQNAVPILGYCLPGRSSDVENTCLPLAKAVDFFTTTYGSYPFSDFKLCFVDDVFPEIIHTGCLAICSNHLLFPEDIIEQMIDVTRKLVHALAVQWIGINIVPETEADTWVAVGIAYYMTDTFMRKLTGNNEYRFNQKIWSDQVVEMDVDRSALYDLGTSLPFDSSALEFMALKAPLVLFILDQRLKKSGMSGMSRIISKIFLNAKVGDLADGAITHDVFVKTCEKLGHANLETFFGQWVQSAGCPKFRVTQRFNKKKLVVEMTIDQVQGENVQTKDIDSSSFLRKIKEKDNLVQPGTPPNFFMGPMTIRIHEADGTPYEHIVEIKERKTRFEVPYNTKYKRLKRTRRQKERTMANAGAEYAAEGNDDVVLYSLGDVLQSADEVTKWRLTDWSAEEEEQMSQESYEWIRMDADFEWICKMSLSMRPYMWVSQLQQDRDVVAQLETMQFLEGQRGHPLISSICIRTLMDTRYFHGIRTAAARILARCAREEHDWIGQFHLEKAFQQLFCYADSPMTRPNDFSNRISYHIQCAIPKAISTIRSNDGRSPFKARQFLLEKLKFNDNSANPYADVHYTATLMEGLASAIASNPLPVTLFGDDYTVDPDDHAFHLSCLEEIDRYRRLDEWIPSYHNILSRTALNCTYNLIKTSLMPLNLATFLQYTADSHFPFLRLTAFQKVLSLGTFKNPPITRYFLNTLSTDPSPLIRSQLMTLLTTTLGALATGEDSPPPQPAPTDPTTTSLIIEQEATTSARALDLSRKQTLIGAKTALAADLSDFEPLKTSLWAAIESPTISLHMQCDLLDICSWLYTPTDAALVVLQRPRFWSCRKTGRGKLTFKADGRVRTEPHTETWPPLAAASKGMAGENATPPLPSASAPSTGAPGKTTTAMNPPLKRTGSLSGGPTRPILKPPKPPKLLSLSTPSSAGNKAASQSPVGASAAAAAVGGVQMPQTPGTPATPGVDGEGKPRITLKLRMGSMGGGGGGAGGSPAG